MTVGNNTVLHIWKFVKKIDPKSSHHKEYKLTLWDDEFNLIVVIIFQYIYMYIYIKLLMLYTLRLYNVIYQLYLNKTGKISIKHIKNPLYDFGFVKLIWTLELILPFDKGLLMILPNHRKLFWARFR